MPETSRRPVVAALDVAVRVLVVTLVALGVQGFRFDVPVQWRDEAATMTATARSWSGWWALVHHVDAVHAFYYAGMKVWFGLVGQSTFTLRLSSLLATALACGAVVGLGALAVDRRVGLLAGLVLAVLPRVTWAATEGRSYGVTILLAVLLALVVVAVLRRPSPWWAPLVLVLTACASATFIYLILLVPALVLAVWWPRRRPTRRWPRVGVWTRVTTTLALVLGVTAALPVILLSSDQAGQVAWLVAPSTEQTPTQVLVGQFFADNGAMAVVGWALAGVGLLALRRRALGPVVALVVGWLAVPVLVLLVGGALLDRTLYMDRYLAFGAPALALLAGCGLAAIRRPAVAAALAALLPILTWASLTDQRRPEAKSKWGGTITAVSSLSRPGDAMIAYFHDTAIRVSYPAVWPGVRILNVVDDAVPRGQLWGTERDLRDVCGALTGVTRLWYLAPRDSARKDAELDVLIGGLGFRSTVLPGGERPVRLLERTAERAVRPSDKLVCGKVS